MGSGGAGGRGGKLGIGEVDDVKANNVSSNKYLELMKNNNPLVIPRNHKVEEALEAAEKNDLKPLTQLIEILKDPYTHKNDLLDYQIPSNSVEKYKTFCGT